MASRQELLIKILGEAIHECDCLREFLDHLTWYASLGKAGVRPEKDPPWVERLLAIDIDPRSSEVVIVGYRLSAETALKALHQVIVAASEGRLVVCKPGTLPGSEPRDLN